MTRETVNEDEDTPSAIEVANNSREPFGPKESKKLLMQHMEETGGITMEEAFEFARIESVRFGPDQDVVNVLCRREELGYVYFDEEAGVYKKASPRRLPNLPPIDYR